MRAENHSLVGWLILIVTRTDVSLVRRNCVSLTTIQSRGKVSGCQVDIGASIAHTYSHIFTTSSFSAKSSLKESFLAKLKLLPKRNLLLPRLPTVGKKSITRSISVSHWVSSLHEATMGGFT